jgi:hypothetical protein
MRKTQVPVLLLTLATMIALSFSSCKNNQEQGEIAASGFGVTNVLKKIPANAAAVGVLDLGQVMKKMDYDAFTETAMFQDMLAEVEGDNAEYLQDLMKNPKNSGIATNGKVCMYVNMESEDDISVNFLLPIRSLKDLEALFDKAAEKEGSPFKNIMEGEGFKYIEDTKNDSKISLGWSKKMLCLSVSDKQNTTNNLTTVFDTKRKESIMTNKKFKADKSEGHDFMLWANSTPILTAVLKNEDSDKQLTQSLFFAGLKKESLNDNVFAWYYNFEKGEMKSGISYNMNEDIVKEYGVIFKSKIKTNFKKYFPVKDMINLTVMGLDTKGILQVLNNRSVTGMADMQLASMGMTTEEILNGLNGDLAIGTYADPNEENPMSANKVVIAIAFENTELIDKLIASAGQMGQEIKKDGNRLKMADYEAFREGGGLIDGKVLILASDAAILDQIEKGGYKGGDAIAKDHYNRMTNGWMGSHVDYRSLMTTVENMSKSPMMRGGFGEMAEMLAQYNQMEAFTAAVTTEEAEAIVSMKNKKENSLKILVDIMNKVYQEQEKYEQDPVLEETTTEETSM